MRALLMVGLILLLSASQACAAEVIKLVAGGGMQVEGGVGNTAKLTTPFGVEFLQNGGLVFVELDGHRVGRIASDGTVLTFAGTGMKGHSGDGGPLLAATFNGPHNLAIGPSDEIYIADTWNQSVRKIDRAGTLSTFAGTGRKGFSGDGGPADKARFGGIYCVTFDSHGKRLLLVDLDNRRIRSVLLETGIVTTLAGNGEKGIPQDGALAAEAPLVDPRAVTADRAGNLYILERGGHALRVVDSQGKIRTVMGTGKAGNSGDGGPAREAQLNGPKHLCVDESGDVIIADTENHVIRRYSPQTGRIERIAGTGRKGDAGVGGPPLECQLSQPHGVTVYKNELYIADSWNHRILKIAERGQ